MQNQLPVKKKKKKIPFVVLEVDICAKLILFELRL